LDKDVFMARHKWLLKSLPWQVLGTPVLTGEPPRGDHDSEEVGEEIQE